MKIFVAFLALAIACAAAGPEDKEAMIAGLAKKINESTNLEELKKEIANGIKNDPSPGYTLDEVNKFVDAICKLWTTKLWSCDEFRAYVVEQKKAAGKIKSK